MDKAILENCARTAHEVNREYCMGMDDYSQPGWGNALEWQRRSALKGVKLVLANPGAGPSVVHDSWLAEKVAEGWVCGPVKDADKKTHPLMMPFEQLPIEQRMKDTLFRATVIGVAAAHSPEVTP